MEPTAVLDEGALPGNWQRQEQRVESGVVETLANVPTGR